MMALFFIEIKRTLLLEQKITKEEQYISQRTTLSTEEDGEVS